MIDQQPWVHSTVEFDLGGTTQLGEPSLHTCIGKHMPRCQLSTSLKALASADRVVIDSEKLDSSVVLLFVRVFALASLRQASAEVSLPELRCG